MGLAARIQTGTVWFGYYPFSDFVWASMTDHQGLEGLIVGQRSDDGCHVRVGDLDHHVAGHREGVGLGGGAG